MDFFFVSPEDWEKDILVLGEYLPWTDYQNNKQIGGITSYPTYSGKILDFKQGKDTAISFFLDKILPKICNNCYFLCRVPSSEARMPNASDILIDGICADSGHTRLINAKDLLIRTKTIKPAHSGGSRDPNVLRKSLALNINYPITNGYVLVIDDITTTGGSFAAAKDMLMAAGAKKVKMLALGKTTHQ